MNKVAAFVQPGASDNAQKNTDALLAVIDRSATDRPIHVLYKGALEEDARLFLDGFRGTTLYAVKCNPMPEVLSTLYDTGVRHFDVASIAELDAALALGPDVTISYMHPIKSPEAIRYALVRGVTAFAIDSDAELEKILKEASEPSRLTIFVRLALRGGAAAYELAGKFGIGGIEAVELLKRVRAAVGQVGVTFHVGSQCMAPKAYADAIQLAEKIVKSANIKIDHLDVGGGFPSLYPGMTPPPMADYFKAIHDAVDAGLFKDVPLYAEPGRALVARSGVLLVEVQARRGNDLYINDGTYGSLFDAGFARWRFPCRKLSRSNETHTHPYRFFGPTCDSMDVMEGPFMLPEDIAEGDWIEIQNIGGYGIAMRTAFNGFIAAETVVLPGAPKPIENKDRLDRIAAE